MAEEALRVPGPLSVHVSQCDGAATLQLVGEFDLENSTAVEQHILSALEDQSRMILDLRDLTFMDSTGIRVLVRTRQECDERDIQLVVLLGGSPVRRVLELVSVTEFLGVAD